MLSTNAMFKSELNIQSLSGTTVEVLQFAQPMVKGFCLFDFWQSQQNIPFELVDQTSGI